jgi:hypothetical protein
MCILFDEAAIFIDDVYFDFDINFSAKTIIAEDCLLEQLLTD